MAEKLRGEAYLISTADKSYECHLPPYLNEAADRITDLERFIRTFVDPDDQRFRHPTDKDHDMLATCFPECWPREDANDGR